MKLEFCENVARDGRGGENGGDGDDFEDVGLTSVFSHTEEEASYLLLSIVKALNFVVFDIRHINTS